MSNQNPIEYIHQETVVIHSGYRSDPTTGAVAVPIYQTASYQFESTKDAENLFALSELGDIYTRIMNPTCHVFRSYEVEGAAQNGFARYGRTAVRTMAAWAAYQVRPVRSR